MNSVVNSDPQPHVMEALEAAKRFTEEGHEYWIARELGPILGYPVFQNFTSLIEKAEAALAASGKDPSHQVMPVHRLMGVGGGARVEGKDFWLSRAASYLIAINGDPTNRPEISSAQIYFATKTRQMELAEQEGADRKRISAREKVTKAFKMVSGVAQSAGVQNRMQAVFHAGRFQGLYEMSRSEITAAKGLGPDENLLEFAGAFELSMHEFQMNLAADVITNEGIKGQQQAIDRNKSVAAQVRQAVLNSRGRVPESLPLEPEPMKAVRKRIADSERGRITKV
jgi:DNA-damage-inducible protein D